MQPKRQISEVDSEFRILGESYNIKLDLDKIQAINGKKETLEENKLAQKIRKNNTMPPSMLSKLKKNGQISHFEDLVHSNVSERIKQRFLIELYKGVKYSLKSLKGPHQDSVLKKKIQLNEIQGSRKKFLFLDLDQTLIFTSKQKNSDVNANQIVFKINVRPYAADFLKNVAKFYDVYVFTAATKAYAQAVIRKLDPSGKIIQDFLSRQHCFQTQRGKMIKDLRIVKNRQLKDIVLVDNKPQSFGLQIDNGIPILEFYGYKDDTELINLQKVLIKMSDSQDVRTSIKEHFKLQYLAEISKEELQDYLKCKKSFCSSEKSIKQNIN